MLVLFLAAAMADTPVGKPSATAATARAQAVVRIVRGAEVRFGKRERLDASIIRTSTVGEPDGARRTATLIEFY